MKSFLLLFLLSVLTLHAQRDTIKIIAIGNSFADDALIEYLWPIAHADGTPMICANMYIGGCTIQRHADNIATGKADYSYHKVVNGVQTNTNNVKLEYGLEDEDWDYVLLQTGQGLYGLYDRYFPEIYTVMEFARKHVHKNFEFVMQQVWAFPDNTVRQSYLSYYGGSHTTMYQTEVTTFNRLKAALHLYAVSPTGTAIENVRRTYVGENVTRDGFHLNKYIGRYTASCAMYETLTGRSCIGNTYQPAHINADYVHIAQQAAHAAVLNPDKPTSIRASITPANYDEQKIPPYTLPDALTLSNGQKVTNKKVWTTQRRPELLSLFEQEMFGKAPGRLNGQHYLLTKTVPNALNGTATMKEVKVFFTANEKKSLTLLMFIPNQRKAKAPAFLGINFIGNHTVTTDTLVTIPKDIIPYGMFNPTRGLKTSRWPLEQIIQRGYAVVTFYMGDVDPDFDDGFANGVHPLAYKKGQTYPAPNEWGSIAAWAWGLSRAMDYLETDPDIDARKVTVFGHSRLGKTALWAGACDERFAAVISNCSGCGGAALSRRRIGETLEAVNKRFNYWFCENFKKYNNNEDALPFDQHELLALIAPRPLYVTSASEDLWADPQGEYLSAKEASKVYQLFGKKGLQDGTIGRHVRQGKHDITLEDWQHYLTFADKYVK